MKRYFSTFALSCVFAPILAHAQSMPIRPAECYGYMSALFAQYVPQESGPLAAMKQRFVNESAKVAPQVKFESGAFMGEMEFKKLDAMQQGETSKRLLQSCLDLRNKIGR